MSPRLLLPRCDRLLDALHVMTGESRATLAGIAERGNHFWFRDDGKWEFQRPDEGGSMLCSRSPHLDAGAAWAALRAAEVIPEELFCSSQRGFAARAEPACDREPTRPCAACDGGPSVATPPTFPLVFALACAPRAVLAAESALRELAVALGEIPPEHVTWRLTDASCFSIEPALLARLVGIDRALGSRERLVHLHGEAGLHREWTMEGYGDAPLSAFEIAVIAHRNGGLDAVPRTGDARHRALRELLETGFGVPCELRRAVKGGLLLTVQPFDMAYA